MSSDAAVSMENWHLGEALSWTGSGSWELVGLEVSRVRRDSNQTTVNKVTDEQMCQFVSHFENICQ